MKKLIILTSILFLTTGLAFAQNGDISPGGDYDFEIGDDIVFDEIPALNNEAIIEQISAENQADIIQRGISNQARIGQGKSEYKFEDEPETGGFFDGIQSEAQPGTAENNQAFIQQLGSNHKADIRQGTELGTTVSAFGESELAINSAEIRQDGENNRASISQGVSEARTIQSTAEIRQTNDSNIASVLQGEGGGYSNRSTGIVHQSGTENWGVILQGASLDPFLLTGGTADGNDATIRQPGNGNGAIIYQGVDRSTLIFSTASITQLSDNNSAIIDQAGSRQSANIIQSN